MPTFVLQLPQKFAFTLSVDCAEILRFRREMCVNSLYVLFFTKILASSCASQDGSLSSSPKTPSYSGPLYFTGVNVMPCTTNDGVPNKFLKNGIINLDNRWESFNIYLDEGYSVEELFNVENVMWNLSQILPCIPFKIWPSNSTPSGDYVHIIRGNSNGCSSYVGKQGGRQVHLELGLELIYKIMNMQSPGCFHPGTITHEFLHALGQSWFRFFFSFQFGTCQIEIIWHYFNYLGFHHEHGRPDRDDFIDIEWGNVIPGLEHAFQKYSWKDVTAFGVAYNIKSIMHYDNYAFSRNGEPTILPKGGNKTESTGSLELQDTDVEKLRRMYNCSSH
ncbi:Zinc metalloproteinase nas-14 [Orchesella cincta]|uniref:Zinc metalloproteinase nas-14 n=1 Tax=Orchesella cincta TaxID=48709 RepID=A0A1D2MY45_ORCCI|nr:Zinc metalloproteinase nas-14 [Orchesella cincta]